VAKKDKKKDKEPSPADAVRGAVEQAATRVRETLDELRLPEELGGLRTELDALAARVAALEASQAPAKPARRAPAKPRARASAGTKPAGTRPASTPRKPAASRSRAKPVDPASKASPGRS